MRLVRKCVCIENLSLLVLKTGFQRAVYNGTLNVKDVLRGAKLTVSMPNPFTYTPAGFVNADSEGSILQGQEAGFVVEVLDELAKRAGFTWRESYAIFDDPEAYDKTWTDLVVSKPKRYFTAREPRGDRNSLMNN